MKKLISLSSSLLLSWLSSSWMKWFTNKFTKYRHMGFVSYQIRLNKACWKTFKVRTTVVFAVQCYEYGIEIYNKKTDKDMYWNEVIFQLLLLFLHQNSIAQIKKTEIGTKVSSLNIRERLEFFIQMTTVILDRPALKQCWCLNIFNSAHNYSLWYKLSLIIFELLLFPQLVKKSITANNFPRWPTLANYFQWQQKKIVDDEFFRVWHSWNILNKVLYERNLLFSDNLVYNEFDMHVYMYLNVRLFGLNNWGEEQCTGSNEHIRSRFLACFQSTHADDWGGYFLEQQISQTLSVTQILYPNLSYLAMI